MPGPSKPTPGYVPPVAWAGEILARKRISKQARSSAKRVLALPTWIADKLATHQAPYRIACWVAWATGAELDARAELALLLRRARSGKGWPDDRHLKAAFGVYLQARAAKPTMWVSGVPVEQYLAALAALPKLRRGSRRATAAAVESTAPMTEDDVLHALVAIRRPRRPRPPAIRLRTTPLPTVGAQGPSLSELLERAQAEIARLREAREQDDVEAQRYKDFLRRDNDRLSARIEQLELDLRARSSGPPKWLVGLGGAAFGAVAGEIARRGVDLLQAGEARAQEAAPLLGEGSATSSPDDEGLLVRLLPVFDDLARARQHAEQGAPSIAEGLRIVQGQLDEALARSGVERVPTVGQLFDPSRHTAVEHVEAPLPGIVLREVLPGYTAGGRLLRAASVVVSKGALMLPK